MRNFTIVLFFLLLGTTTMMAQSVKEVTVSQNFEINAGAVPEAGTMLEFDFSSFGFATEAKAKRVIAGFNRNIKVDFATKKAQIQISDGLWAKIGNDQAKFDHLMRRLSAGLQNRAKMF